MMLTKLKGFMFKALLLIVTAVTLNSPAYADTGLTTAALLPAFPGAEGGGMYTTGGRGGAVYEVTNLNDSGPGSFRDAVSQGNRTIVFRVSGNIDLKSKLFIKGSNLTIAGQTAPGDGISVNNYPTFVQANNLVIRYIRFRMGDVSGAADDSMSIRKYKNIVIDHCSFNWAIDEVLSPYENSNVTVQWSIIGEALTMSIHKKGRHGFGGLWGAGNSTYHHNLLIHNASRNPRFKGTVTEDPTLDYRNNVVYNWNYLSAYGGDAADINMINNYYKYGPDTLLTKRSTVLEQTGTRGKLYIAGNVIDGNPDVTADNWLGVSNEGKLRVDEPIPAYPVTTESAEAAYESVLAGAGAVLPKRDPVDARLISDVRNRTGRQINTPGEVGGYPELQSLPAPVDSDHDGMPDDWETAHGLNPLDPADRNLDNNSDGYTNLEKYLNGIPATGTQNPNVKLTSPALNTVTAAGGSILLEAEAADPDGTVAKVEFYSNAVKLGEATASPYRFTWSNIPEGTYYVRARAVDNSGTSTDSATVPVHSNASGDIAPWSSADIGTTGIPGHTDLRNGIFTVKGAGNWRENDSFHFAYRKLAGDGEIVARVDHMTDTAPNNRAGVMIREKLTPGAREAMMALSVRGEAYVGVFYNRSTEGAALAETPPITGVNTPYWVKLVKLGDTITGYLSADGASWKQVSSATLAGSTEVYIGLAVDAAKENNLIENYNASTFSQVAYNGPPQTEAQLSGTEGLNDWYVSDVTVSLSATDDKSGVASTDYALTVVQSVYGMPSTGGFVPYSSPIVLSDGIYELQYRSTDNDGYVEAVKSVTIKIDKTAPTFALTANGIPLSDGSQIVGSKSVVLALQSADSLSGVASQSMTVDGTPYVAGTALNWSGKPHTLLIQIVVSDQAGNVTQATINVNAITVGDALKQLIQLVTAYLKTGEINEPLLHQLIVIINQAFEQLSKGHADMALGQLQDFITNINKQPPQGSLSAKAKQNLTAAASEIIAALSK